jgi:hypothetical protein
MGMWIASPNAFRTQPARRLAGTSILQPESNAYFTSPTAP